MHFIVEEPALRRVSDPCENATTRYRGKSEMENGESNVLEGESRRLSFQE